MQSPGGSISNIPFAAFSDQGRCAPTSAHPMPSRMRYLARARTSPGMSSRVTLCTQLHSFPVCPSGSVGMCLVVIIILVLVSQVEWKEVWNTSLQWYGLGENALNLNISTPSSASLCRKPSLQTLRTLDSECPYLTEVLMVPARPEYLLLRNFNEVRQICGPLAARFTA